jgi:hypothetical protein
MQWLLYAIEQCGYGQRTITSHATNLPISVGFDSLWLPNNLAIAYPQLHRNKEDNEYRYKGANEGWVRIYGAKVVENVSQALARIIVTDIACRVFEETRFHPFLSTHDSLDLCVPYEDAEAVDAELTRQFALAPAWAPGLPLASEGGWGKNLADAERGTND